MPRNKDSFDTEPLTEKERDHLLLIYYQRLRVFAPAFLLLTIAAIYFSITKAESPASESLPFIEQAFVNFAFAGGPVMLFAIIIYHRRIKAYRTDVKNGLKQLVPFKILERKHFPLTGQYYFRIPDPDNMYYEVDAEMFHQYRAGDSICVSRAPLSGYTFEYGGRFSLM